MKRFTLTFFLIALTILSVVPASAHIPVPESERFVRQAIPSFDDRFERDLGVKYPSMSWTAADWIRWQTPRRYAEKGHVPGIHISWVICHNNPVMYVDLDGRKVRLPSDAMGPKSISDLKIALSEVTYFSTDDFDVSSGNTEKMLLKDELYVKKDALDRFRQMKLADPTNKYIKPTEKLIDILTHCTVVDIWNPGDLANQRSRRIIQFGLATISKNEIALDIQDFANIDYRGVNRLTYGLGTLFFHEISHILYGTLDESGDDQEAYEWVNQNIRIPLGLERRISYGARIGDRIRKRIYLQFDGGRIYYPYLEVCPDIPFPSR